jgi:hypothetical protein
MQEIYIKVKANNLKQPIQNQFVKLKMNINKVST